MLNSRRKSFFFLNFFFLHSKREKLQKKIFELNKQSEDETLLSKQKKSIERRRKIQYK